MLGEEVDGADGTVTLGPPRFRPLPNSPVFALTSEQTAALLHCGGDIRLGLAVGHEKLEVGIPSHSKDVLPRHTGIVGTTGGGKSTTVAGLIARMQAAGYPGLELSHILDVVGAFAHVIGKQSGDFAPFHRDFQTAEGKAKLLERVKQPRTQTSHVTSWGAVRGRLFRLQRVRVFDQAHVAHLPYRRMLEPGQVSIVDLHDTDSVQVNNSGFSRRRSARAVAPARAD